MADNAHPLQVRIKLKSFHDDSVVASLTLKGKDHFRVRVGLIERKIAEVKGFYLHGISHKLASGLDFDDGVIGCHVGQCIIDVGIILWLVQNLIDCVLIVDDRRYKFITIERN